jgi:hypothetical protein
MYQLFQRIYVFAKRVVGPGYFIQYTVLLHTLFDIKKKAQQQSVDAFFVRKTVKKKHHSVLTLLSVTTFRVCARKFQT